MPTAHAVPCTSVVPAAHVPVLPRIVVINAVHAIVYFRMPLFTAKNLRLKVNFHVPFILTPYVFPPPIPRTAPRPRSRRNLPAQSAKINSRRKFLAHLHPRHPFGTKNAQRQCRSYSRNLSSSRSARRPSTTLRFPLQRAEPLHANRSRPVRIQYLRRANVWLACQILQSRHGQFQFLCVHRIRLEKLLLRCASSRGFCGKRDFANRCLRRLPLQLQSQQVQKQFRI